MLYIPWQQLQHIHTEQPERSEHVLSKHPLPLRGGVVEWECEIQEGLVDFFFGAQYVLKLWHICSRVHGSKGWEEMERLGRTKTHCDRYRRPLLLFVCRCCLFDGIQYIVWRMKREESRRETKLWNITLEGDVKERGMVILSAQEDILESLYSIPLE